MKSILYTIVLIIVFNTCLLAQTDSLSVINANWRKEKIAPGVYLKTFSFNKSLFNSNQNVSILEIKQKKSLEFDLGYESKALIPTSEYGRRSNAIAAINGTFFDMANGGSVDYIKSDGKLINENRLGKSSERAIHQKAAVIIKNGKLSINKWNGLDNWENLIDAEDIMVSGPLLILNGKSEDLDKNNTFNKTRHPRTAVAVNKNKRVLLITVDGRNENAQGMSLFELEKLLRWIKAVNAINLDGGGSTALWINNYGENGIVNYPTDNKKWDHNGERKVANVVLLKKR